LISIAWLWIGVLQLAWDVSVQDQSSSTAMVLEGTLPVGPLLPLTFSGITVPHPDYVPSPPLPCDVLDGVVRNISQEMTDDGGVEGPGAGCRS